MACPGPLGGVEWNGPSYSPETKSIYIGTTDWCANYTTKKGAPGAHGLDLGGSYTLVPGAQSNGWIYAVDSASGKVNWRHRMDGPVIGGVTTTASGVLLAGDSLSNFVALDSENGKPLLQRKLEGAIAGGVITYSVNGQQFVASTSGNVSRGTFGVTGTPMIVIMKVSEAVESPKVVKVQIPETEEALSASVSPGQKVFQTYCTACHGASGEGVSGPALKGIAKRRNLANLIAWIKDPSEKMPKLFPAPLSENDVKAVAKYISKLK